ncbi:hypothetical protein B0T17DRAFT_498707, partial [Bombardia bombarda]
STMASPDPETTSEPQVVFRAGKKRKTYRQRSEDTEAAVSNKDATPTPAAAAPIATAPTVDSNDEAGEGGMTVAEALRLRNARKHKNIGGVEFRAGAHANSSNTHNSDEQHNAEQGMVLHDGSGEAHRLEELAMLGGITQRFASQTGLVGELASILVSERLLLEVAADQAREEYIESELARRNRLAAETWPQQNGGRSNSLSHGNNNNRTNTNAAHMGSSSSSALRADPTLAAAGVPVESQRVLQGRLLEIDLGEEARARNIAMTERARRRLEGHSLDDDDDEGGDNSNGEHPRKVRLGRDGKPWRPRNQRNSDDIMRDQLVEEFLSENTLGIYDVPSEQPAAAGLGDDEEAAADDRIAEEFRRQFMDAMSQRHRRRKPAVNASAKPAAKVNQDEILRGPKLGGSRNARAAMRDKLLKEQESRKRR